MSCDGCEQTAKGLTRGHEKIINKAADYAKEKNVWVGIYATPEASEGYGFIELAHSAGFVILERISPAYRPSTS